MKSILLTSAAIVAFAGAASAKGHASVTFNGDAELGYNDDDQDGIFWGMGLSVTGTAALDNGLTAGISGDVEFANSGQGSTYGGNSIEIDDLVISLKNDTAGLYFGDTNTAAASMWSGVTNMNEDGFQENDDGTNEDAVLRGEVSFGAVETMVSYYMASATNELVGLSFGAKASLGSVTLVAAYQEDTTAAETGVALNDIFGLSASMSLGGADVVLAYSDDNGDASTGIQVTYPVGAVTLKAFYVMEDAVDDNYGLEVAYSSGPLSINAHYHDGDDEETALQGSYDMGNGVVINAGFVDTDGGDGGTYIGADIDLGGGASLLLSFGDADTEGDDEFGAQDYKDGMTVKVSMSF